MPFGRTVKQARDTSLETGSLVRSAEIQFIKNMGYSQITTAYLNASLLFAIREAVCLSSVRGGGKRPKPTPTPSTNHVPRRFLTNDSSSLAYETDHKLINHNRRAIEVIFQHYGPLTRRSEPGYVD